MIDYTPEPMVRQTFHASPGDAGADTDPGPGAAEFVPFTWHGLPPAAYEEFIHSYNLAVVWHLTAADPVFPMVCLRMKVPYFGIGFEQSHIEALRDELVNLVFVAMQDPLDPLYEHELAVLLGVEDAAGPETTKAKAKPKGKAKAASESKAGEGNKSLLAKLKQLDDNEDAGADE